jgi:hypothetical protein
MLALVTLPIPKRQSGSSRDWTFERRAKAAVTVQHFILELATDPLLPSFPVQHLRAVYPLHAQKQLALWFLQLARARRWNSGTLHEAVRSFLQEGLLRRCHGDWNCWLHDHLRKGVNP